MSTSNPFQKYRPYFTLRELETLLAATKTVGSSPHLIRYLEGYISKITLEETSPALTLTPKQTLADKLGFGPSPAESLSSQGASLSDLKHLSYAKWKISPLKCSAQEIARAQMYRYEHDMMTPDEESEYEKKQDIGY